MEAYLPQEFETHEMDPWTKQINGLSTFPNPSNQVVVAPAEIFQCPFPDCDYESTCYRNVVIHEIRHGPLATRVLTCQFCVRNFESLFNFLRHMSSLHPNKLVCPLCPFVGQEFSEFKSHVLAHRVTGTNELACTSLDSPNHSSPPQLLQSHVNIRDEIDPEIEIIEIQENQTQDGEGKLMDGRQGSWSCDKCSYKTSLSQDMRMHTRIHSRRKLFKCPNPFCYYVGHTPKGLQVHQRSCYLGKKTRSLREIIDENSKDLEPRKEKAATFEAPNKIAIDYPAKTKSQGMTEVPAKKVLVQRDRLYSSISCHYGSKLKTNITRQTRVNTDHKPFSCPVNSCNYRANSLLTLRDHSKTVHYDEILPDMPVKPKEDSRLDKECEIVAEVKLLRNCNMAFHCMLCEFVGESESSAWEHARKHQTVVGPSQ